MKHDRYLPYNGWKGVRPKPIETPTRSWGGWVICKVLVILAAWVYILWLCITGL